MNRFGLGIPCSMNKLLLFFSLILFCRCKAQGQIWKKALTVFDKQKQASTDLNLPIEISQLNVLLKEDCRTLSSPKLGGRVMGTKGAEMAGIYIGQTMNRFGAAPYARNFVHTFSYVSGKVFTPETRCTIGDSYLFIPEEAFPAPYSATGEVRNYILPDSREFGQPWIIPLYQNQNQANDAKFDWISATFKRAQIAQNRGASAVLFYDSYGSSSPLKYIRSSSFPILKIPVIIVCHKAYEKKIKNISVLTPFYLGIKFRDEYAKAANIIGFIDNNAQKNVLICAHYDGHPNRLETSSEAANDNASGVAVMMSLARLLRKSNAKKYNYILAAVSGGAMDQMGSKALLDDKDFDKSTIAYVINLDRVGDMNSYGDLYVNGVSSSSGWVSFFEDPVASIHYNFEKEQIAPSDNLTFLKQNIPTLSFSTDLEEDSNAEDNSYQQLNFRGMDSVISLVYRLVVTMNQLAPPTFSSKVQEKEITQELNEIKKLTRKTRSSNLPEKVIAHRQTIKTTPVEKSILTPMSHSSFWGIVYDSSYTGYGVRISKVMNEQPAATAGLKPGDVIMEIAGTKINTFSDFKHMVDSLNTGQKVEVKVKRGVTVQKFSLQIF